jgi:hypothetical protein
VERLNVCPVLQEQPDYDDTVDGGREEDERLKDPRMFGEDVDAWLSIRVFLLRWHLGYWTGERRAKSRAERS